MPQKYKFTKFGSYYFKGMVALFLALMLYHFWGQSWSPIDCLLAMFFIYIIIDSLQSILWAANHVFDIRERIENWKEKRKLKAERKRLHKNQASVQGLSKLAQTVEQEKERILLELEAKLSDESLPEEEKEKLLLEFLDKQNRFDNLKEKTTKVQRDLNTTITHQNMLIHDHSPNRRVPISIEQQIQQMHQTLSIDEYGMLVVGHHRLQAMREVAEIHDRLEDSMTVENIAPEVAQAMIELMNDDLEDDEHDLSFDGSSDNINLGHDGRSDNDSEDYYGFDDQ